MLTFHRILAGCEEGNRGAWRSFVSGYTPIVFELLGIYVPIESESREALWRDSLAELARNDCERLRSFDHQAEREFLYDLRADVLERGARKLDPAKDSQSFTPSLETVQPLLQGLPLIHQEIVVAKLAGYSNARMERLLKIAPAVAQASLERLRTACPELLDRPADRCLWPSAWGEFTRAAIAKQTPDCPPLRQFVRVLDGQHGWHDKESTEKQVRSCACCLTRWVALREVIYWRRDAKACPPSQVEALLSEIPLEYKAPPRKSFLQRFWS